MPHRTAHKANPPKRVSKAVWAKMSPAHQKILASRLESSGKKPYKKAYSKSGGKGVSSSSEAKCKKEIKKEVSRTAMGPSMDGKAAICTDAFRIGEYSDMLTELQTSPLTGYNQIFIKTLVNPRTLISLAKKGMASRKEVPPHYKLEGYTENYYQYSFNSLEIEITNTVPQNCSGDLMAFFIPDINANISQYNVLDIFDSIRGVNGKDSHNAIIIPPGKTKSLHLNKTALLFTKFTDQASEDKRLSMASVLVLAAMSTFLSASSITTGSNSEASRRWGAEVAIVKLKTSCHFYGKQYVPAVVNGSGGVANAEGTFLVDEGSTFVNAVQANVFPVPNSNNSVQPNQQDVNVPSESPPLLDLVNGFGPDALTAKTAFKNQAILQAQLGEMIGVLDCLGDKQSKSRQNKAVWTKNPNALLANANFFEWSWEGAFDWVTTAIGGFVKGKLELLFGDVAGGALYDIGKELMYFTWDTINAPDPAPLSSQNVDLGHGTNYHWLADGTPSITNLGDCVGLLQPYSQVYNAAVDYFKVHNPSLYANIETLKEAGQALELVFYPNVALNNGPGVQPTALNGPLINSTGDVECEFVDNSGVLTLEEGFGQPIDIVGGDPLAQLASTGVSDRGIGIGWAETYPLNQYKQVIQRAGTPVSFYMYWVEDPVAALYRTLCFATGDYVVSTPIAGSWLLQQVLLIDDFIAYLRNNSSAGAGLNFGSQQLKFKLKGHFGPLDPASFASAAPTGTTVTNYTSLPNTIFDANPLAIYRMDQFPGILNLQIPFTAGAPSTYSSIDADVCTYTCNNLFTGTQGNFDLGRLELKFDELFATPNTWYHFEGYLV